MYNTVFWIIIALIVLDFLFEKYLDYLNTTKWSNKLPEELVGIYDAKKYAKQQKYERTNHRFGTVTDSLNIMLILCMFVFFGFALVDQWAWNITTQGILAALVFFGILMFASDIIHVPFSIYSTFVIEEKFGFNKTTPKTFILDKIKGWLVGGVIGGGILALIIFIYQISGELFWVYAWIAVGGFSIFMAMFYSNLIVPLFNKQTPLEEGELRNAIQKYADEVSFKLDNIYVIDGSKRSTKSNAYFTGLGSKKRIVLYDTLIKELEIEELVAVLAHEVGHNKKKHVVQGLLLSLVQTGFVLFLFSLFVDNKMISQALGVTTPNFHIGMVAFGILYSPVSFVLGIAMNVLSRKNEYQADRFAAQTYSAERLGSALKKLSVSNLSNLTPHKTYVFFHYSHPTLLQRLKHLKKFEQDAPLYS